MKVNVLNLNGEKVKQIDLPKQFSEEIRQDVIQKAFIIKQTWHKQQYGANQKAGKRASAWLSRRRRDYKGGYGRGMSRIPRKVLIRRGTQFIYAGAFAPGTRGGRRAHPPKAEKLIRLSVNKKENRKAIRSAIAASIKKDMLKKKGFSAIENLPLILDNKVEEIKKTKELIGLFKKIKLDKELERTKKKRVRSGKGKIRGRKYKKKVGPLFIVSKDCSLQKAISNVPGFESCVVNNLNIELLAPGAEGGRLLVWSLSAIEKLGKEGLFMQKKKNGRVQDNKKSTNN